MKIKRIFIVSGIVAIALIICLFLIFTNNSPKTITGTVTEVSIDCQPSRTFENGVVVTASSALCDKGSSVKVNDTYFTAFSSYIPGGNALGEVEPGDTVEVTYVEPDTDSTTIKSLECESCGFKIIKKFEE